MVQALFETEKLHVDLNMRLVNMIDELKDFGVLDSAAAIPSTSQCQTSQRWIGMVVDFDKYFCRFVARGFQRL
jgi:hypothetical protein